MGSRKRRGGVNSIKVGQGRSIKLKGKPARVREFSVEELSRMPLDAARGLIHILKGTKRKSIPQKKGSAK